MKNLMVKYELRNRKNVRAYFAVDNGIVVKTDPILCWIKGWTFEDLQEYCISGCYRRLIITKLEDYRNETN